MVRLTYMRMRVTCVCVAESLLPNTCWASFDLDLVLAGWASLQDPPYKAL